MPRRVKTLADLGESALIERIRHRAGATASGWALSIGDDAAILRPRKGEELVFSTDAQVEGVHFKVKRETSRTIGRRAMAVNLSDLAAMGTTPVGALLSLSAPQHTPLALFDGLIDGFVREGEAYNCPLVGGNLTRADVVSLHVTVIGRAPSGRSLRRRGLNAGDTLFVTGTLGGATLSRLRADASRKRVSRVPEPRIQAGRALARMAQTRACIDLSDGLATDLAHLLAGDGLGAHIDADRLPRPRGFDRGCAALGCDPLQVIACGGEDYELLFALRSKRKIPSAAALSGRLGVAVTRIGEITSEKGVSGLDFEPPAHHF